MSNKLEFRTTIRLSTTNNGPIKNERSFDPNIWVQKVIRVGFLLEKSKTIWDTYIKKLEECLVCIFDQRRNLVGKSILLEEGVPVSVKFTKIKSIVYKPGIKGI